MRIAVITPVYPHAGSPVEGLFNALHARALKNAGVDVSVILCKPWLPRVIARMWKRYQSLVHLPAGGCHAGIPVASARFVQVPGYRFPQVTVADCARGIVKVIERQMARKPFDMLQVHSVWPVGLAASVAAEKLGIPFVVTLHIQDDPELYRAKGGRRFYRQMVSKAAALVAVGTPLYNFMETHFPAYSHGRLSIIPNGVDAAAIANISDKVDESRNGNAWGRIVSVGNLWPVKGIEYNLKALAILEKRDVSWHSYTIVGDGVDRDRLKKLAMELGILHKVRFTGRLPHNKAITEIVKSDIFSLPSWQESFGVAYLEAMACKKPVIGCLGQGAEDIIAHEKNGLLVSPRDEIALADALAWILENKDLATRYGQSGALRAGEFTWEKNAQAYIRLYENILDNRKRANTDQQRKR